MAKFMFSVFVWSHVAVFSLGCERRNYVGMCPEGWVAAGVCLAPLSYGGRFSFYFLLSCNLLVMIAGPCAGTASLGDFSEGMKRQFEENCRVQCEKPRKIRQDKQERFGMFLLQGRVRRHACRIIACLAHKIGWTWEMVQAS